MCDVHWLDTYISTEQTDRLGATRKQITMARLRRNLDWTGLSSVLCPRQHSIGYMGDGFYRSKDPTNSMKELKEQNSAQRNQTQ